MKTKSKPITISMTRTEAAAIAELCNLLIDSRIDIPKPAAWVLNRIQDAFLASLEEGAPPLPKI